MNTMINLNVVLEHELELERLGFSRTSRWIGNRNRAADESWYRRNSTLAGTTVPSAGMVEQAAGTSTPPLKRSSSLARLLRPSRPHRQSACENC
ncbi:MAG: hypothetical protein MUC85_04020 [Anaerolineales bacterium]|jgi:hypothetical protein|nr:hypothetical protein [Anaerolineales bacterium]